MALMHLAIGVHPVPIPAAATPATLTPDPTWFVVARDWLECQRSPHTRDAYARDFDQFQLWLRTARPPVGHPLEARRIHVDEYAISLRRFKPATQARKLAAVSSYYAYAVTVEAIDTNPAATVRRPPLSNTSPRMGLTTTEAHRVIDAADNATAAHRALLALCLGAGLRISEALAVRPADISTVKGHTVLTVTGKGDKVRTVPLSPQALRLLADALARCHAADHRIIDTDDNGHPIDRHRALRMVEALGRTAGVGHRLRPHDLRHTAATLALDAGAPIHRVQDLLGHASPITTQRYVQHRERLDNSAAYLLGTVLAGGIS